MANRYCGNCGQELSPDNRFCPSCGRPVHETARVATPEADVDVPPPPGQAGSAGSWQTGSPQTGSPQGGSGWGRKALTGCLGAVGVLFLLIVIGTALSGGDETAAGGEGGDAQQNQGEAIQDSDRDQGDSGEAQQAAPEDEPEPENQKPNFGDGTYQVGTDIQPGTYRTREGSSGCYYERLSGFSGEFDDILANGNADAPAIIAIKPTDAGFTSQDCGTWTKDLSAITESKTSFGEGAYIVGTDIEPGTYRNSGSSGCYYERLSSFTGDFNGIIANGNADEPAVVTIEPTDAGFQSNDCGTWTKLE